MKKCRNCIYIDRCLNHHGFMSVSGMESWIGQDCASYEDKSQYIKLPCKLGDEIFCTTMGRIYQGIVGRIELDDEGFNIITTDGYCFDSSICYHTQEEAEQALKEREIND